MKLYTIIISTVSIIGGSYWIYLSGFDPEPIILVFTSICGLIFGLFYKNEEKNTSPAIDKIEISRNSNSQNNLSGANNISINIENTGHIENRGNIESKEIEQPKQLNLKGDDLIDHLKRKLKVLFIDDDSDFQIVKILRNSGWNRTSSTVDVKNLNMSSVKDSDILFIDIRGVGKSMNLPDEGLDLAFMIKQKYPEKIVVIYSANPHSNSFHDAWNIIDGRLMKNALPIEFENLIVEYGKKIITK